jgi:hypothetical protein
MRHSGEMLPPSHKSVLGFWLTSSFGEYFPKLVFASVISLHDRRDAISKIDGSGWGRVLVRLLELFTQLFVQRLWLF